MKDVSTTSIMLVDDHPMILRGYRSAIKREEGLSVAGDATSGEEALKVLESVVPDLIVVDLAMAEMDGFELTRRIRERLPDLPILVISMYGDPAHIREAVAAGANGYLLKEEAESGLFVDALREMLEAGTFFSEKVRNRYDPDTS